MSEGDLAHFGPVWGRVWRGRLAEAGGWLRVDFSSRPWWPRWRGRSPCRPVGPRSYRRVTWGGTGSQMRSRRGDFWTERFQRQRSPLGTRSDLWCTLCLGSRLSRGIFSYCKATAVRRDTERNVVLAGDPKVFRLLCNTNLNKNIPSRGSKEERIRILLQVWANIQGNGYNK